LPTFSFTGNSNWARGSFQQLTVAIRPFSTVSFFFTLLVMGVEHGHWANPISWSNQAFLGSLPISKAGSAQARKNFLASENPATGDDTMTLFLYGLFMDETLLATKGIAPTDVSVGFVEGYGLRIGRRATLVRCPGVQVYGVAMAMGPGEAGRLYAEEGVADYVPEPVTVELMDGTKVEATCYNLPADKVGGTNKEYAESLLELATKLGLPESYLNQIRQAER
jgi:hypothetical protein